MNITKEDIIKPENLVYEKTDHLTKKTMSYCPGCGHGTAHRILMELVEEKELQQQVKEYLYKLSINDNITKEKVWIVI